MITSPLFRSAGYFSVKLSESEEFWLNPGDFLGFSGTGSAGGIGYRFKPDFSFSNIFNFAAIARWRKPTTTTVETRLRRRRAL